MKSRFLLLSGSRQHPESQKMGYLFLALVILAVSIFHFYEGDRQQAMIMLLASVTLSTGILFLFSSKTRFLPFLEITEELVTLKNSIFQGEIQLEWSQIEAISIAKNSIMIVYGNKHFSKGELSSELTTQIKEAIEQANRTSLLS